MSIEDFMAEQAYELSQHGHEPWTLNWIADAVPVLLWYLVLTMFVGSFMVWGLRGLVT